MNPPVSEELRMFHHFVGNKLEQGQCALSPEEVLEEWRELHPDANGVDEAAETVRAVRQALADMEAGDRGTPSAEIVTTLRNRLHSSGA